MVEIHEFLTALEDQLRDESIVYGTLESLVEKGTVADLAGLVGVASRPKTTDSIVAKLAGLRPGSGRATIAPGADSRRRATLSFFLLTYRRGAPREEPTIDSFEDPIEAMERFAAAERAHRELGDGRGVVLLIADNEQTLRKTHTHYFFDAESMLQRVAG